jgi:hypothetical protein
MSLRPDVTICYIGFIIPKSLGAPGAQIIHHARRLRAREAIMRKCILAVTLAALALTTAALAADPWKQKKPEEWKQEDIHKILNDSPWSRPYEIMLPATGQDLGGGSDMTTNAAMGATGGGGGGRGRGRGNASPDAEQGRAIVYLAQWYSSRTVRAAQVRSAELAGSPVPKENALFTVPENYQVVLQGGNTAAFGKLGEEGLKKSCYLELKKTHQRIAPSRVAILQARGRVIAVAFEFPKKVSSGEPSIGSDEKNVDFVAASDQVNLKFHFDLGKMLDQQGADL